MAIKIEVMDYKINDIKNKVWKLKKCMDDVRETQWGHSVKIDSHDESILELRKDIKGILSNNNNGSLPRSLINKKYLPILVGIGVILGIAGLVIAKYTGII